MSIKEQLQITIVQKMIVRSPFAKGNCKEYILDLTYNNKTMRYTFYDSVYNYENNQELNKFETLYAILTDRRAYRYSRSVEDFAKEFGYTDEEKARKVYSACKKIAHDLERLFTEEELEQLEQEVEV